MHSVFITLTLQILNSQHGQVVSCVDSVLGGLVFYRLMMLLVMNAQLPG